MKLTSRLKAGSLVITIVISIIVGTICLFLLLQTYYNRNQEAFYRISKKLDLNLSSGVEIILADTANFANGQADSIDLFGDGDDSVIISRYYWGAYNVSSVKAEKKSWQRTRAFLYGSGTSKYNEGCIYLADHKRPLYVVGSTKLEGNAYLSNSGISIAYINQRGYESSELIKGTIKSSEEYLPPVNLERLMHLESLMKYDSTVLHPENLPDTLTGNFDSLPSKLCLHGNIVLSKQVLTDNIIITSDSSVTIDSSAALHNIMICAPKILVKSGFIGTVQLIARELIIGPDCWLKYPSSLIVIQGTLETERTWIKIGERSKVQGVIIGVAPTKSSQLVFFEAAKGSTVEGNIYIQGFSDIKGKVFGSIATDYFIYKSDAMIYENHLVDVEVSHSKLFKGFAGSTIIPGFPNYQIIQWLN